MNKFTFNILLFISKLVSVYSIIIVIFLFFLILYKKKLNKFVTFVFVFYLEIFLIFFPINLYGIDLINFLFLKSKLTSKSFDDFKRDISRNSLEEKIIFAYGLSYEIKESIKELEKEYEEVKIKLKTEDIKGVEKNFLYFNEITDII